ncbi:hypothetical protein WICPIJ_006546 [Wickerhamomyces pijperi]|uniref:F-box domain-containing protein n=1 Tax=Wickerhamomyces pijperi TaxID=599730 RepID=A0A9P8Q1I8_WICPI|nr:hypothetical protein WICPIJ_006546 [Wickerhamomyces pijperi]
MIRYFSSLPPELQLQILRDVNSISTIRSLNTIERFKSLIDSIVAIISVQFANKLPYNSLTQQRLSKDVHVLNFQSLQPLFYDTWSGEEFDWDAFQELILLKAKQKHYIVFEIHAYQDEKFIPRNTGIRFQNKEMSRYLHPIRTLQTKLGTTVFHDTLDAQNLHFDFYEDLDSFLLGQTGQSKQINLLKHSFWPWQSEKSVKRYFLDLAQSMVMMHPLDFYDEVPIHTASSKELLFQTRQHFNFEFIPDSFLGLISEAFDQNWPQWVCTFPSSSALYGLWQRSRTIEIDSFDHLFELVKMDAVNGAQNALEYLQKVDAFNRPHFSISSDLVLILQPGRDRLYANIHKPRKIQNPGLSVLNMLRPDLGQRFQPEQERSRNSNYKRPERHQTDIFIKEKSTKFDTSLKTLTNFFKEIKSWSEEFAFEQQVLIDSSDISKYLYFDNINKIIQHHQKLERHWRSGLSETNINLRRFDPLVRDPNITYMNQLTENTSKKDIVASRVNPMIANNFLLASMLYGSQSESYEDKVDIVRINFTNDRYDMVNNIIKELTEYYQMAKLVLFRMRKKKLF